MPLSRHALAALLAIAALATTANADDTCDQYAADVWDELASAVALVTTPNVNAIQSTPEYSDHKNFLAAFALIPAPHPRYPDYSKWSFTRTYCLLPAARCESEGTISACAAGLCPPMTSQYPLGGMLYRKRWATVKAQNDLIPLDGAGLSPNVQRAWPQTLAVYAASAHDTRIWGNDPLGGFVDASNQNFNCKALHANRAAVDERQGWGRVLLHALDAFRDQAFEGVDVPATKDLEINIVEGKNRSALRVRVGDIYDSTHVTFNEDYSRREQGASSQWTTKLGAWPGGKLPMRVTPDGAVWSPGQWTADGPKNDHEHLPGYRTWRISSSLAPDWEVDIRQHDDVAPECLAKAVLVDETHAEVSVVENDDWDPVGQISAASAVGAAPPVKAAQARVVVPMGKGETAVTVECVDAAGNKKSVSVQAAPPPPPAPPASQGVLAEWSRKANDHTCPADVGKRFTYTCPSNGYAQIVWGTDVYTHDSSICTAAVHAGKITMAGGTVTIEMRPGQGSYGGSTRNGVTTTDWPQWDCSFVFVDGTTTFTTTPSGRW